MSGIIQSIRQSSLGLVALLKGGAQVPLVAQVRWQEKTLGANVTANNTDFLEFTGLTPGKTYRFSGTVTATASNVDDIAWVAIRHGTTDVKQMTLFVGGGASQDYDVLGFNYLFIATQTSIKLRTSDLVGGTILASSNSIKATWATLEELSGYVQASSF